MPPPPTSHAATPVAPPAVVLLSGGLDSATVAAVAARDGFAVHALSVDYGQRHRVELEAARRVAAALGAVEHRVVALDLRGFGGSALTADVAVPKDRDVAAIAAGVPSTYVPARNTILLSLALAWAEVLGAADLYVGVHAQDSSGYPDCRPEYLAAYEAMANLATRAATEEGRRVAIHAPLVELGKAQIVALAADLGVDLSLTISCYDPDPGGAACGRCDACALRRRSFVAAGLPDPTRYRGG